MSSNLWPVKLEAIFDALKKEGILAQRAAPPNVVQAPEDDLTRILLCAPDLQRQVAKETGLPDFRIRIAYPADWTFLSLVDLAQFEVYTVDGAPAQAPVLLTELGAEMSNAVQVELLTLLLEARGIKIPTM